MGVRAGFVVRWWRVSGLRPIAGPFVAAAPAGARVRARLRVSPQDEAVLRAAGSYLGSLAGGDLAARCAAGRLDPGGRAVSRAARKRALTARSSSRWAGAITRTSEDQWCLAERNLRAARASLQARVRRIEARLAIAAGGRRGRTRGYATPSERHGKVLRLHALKARLARVERQLEAGTVPVVRGGRALLRKRASLAAAGLDEDRWRAQWEAARLFLTADGEKDKPWGNETIRWPRRMLAGDQAPGTAVAPGEPAARPLPDLGRGGVLLSRRRGRRAGGRRRHPLRHRLRPGTRPLVHRRILEGRARRCGAAG